MKDLTPKEKAKELVETFSVNLFSESRGWYIDIDESKDMAKLAVNEILKVSLSYAGRDYDYYQEVKQEIEKL